MFENTGIWNQRDIDKDVDFNEEDEMDVRLFFKGAPVQVDSEV